MYKKPVKESKWDFLTEKESTTPKEASTKKLKLSYSNKNSAADTVFYQKAWQASGKRCEECGMELHGFSRFYISHILSKGAFPSLRHDMDNYNCLCLTHHAQYETGKRREMKIWETNKEKIKNLLKKVYG